MTEKISDAFQTGAEMSNKVLWLKKVCAAPLFTLYNYYINISCMTLAGLNTIKFPLWEDYHSGSQLMTLDSLITTLRYVTFTSYNMRFPCHSIDHQQHLGCAINNTSFSVGDDSMGSDLFRWWECRCPTGIQFFARHVYICGALFIDFLFLMYEREYCVFQNQWCNDTY